MSQVRTLTVAPDEADQRLDRWFRRRFPDLGHGRLEKLLRTGQVRVDGGRAKAGTRLSVGQKVRVPPVVAAQPPAQPTAAPAAAPAPPEPRLAADLRAAVLYRDASVLALNKPPGLAVQGGTGQRRHVDAMLDALRLDAAERPRLVHRLDKDTSGVLLLARSAPAARRLTAAFRDQTARKVYWALVAGVPRRGRGVIDLPLEKRGGRGGEAVEAGLDDARPARTLYQVVAARPGGRPVAWLVLMPRTGRTHQLRAHCAAMGTPVVGDGKYGGRDAFVRGLPNRLMLHAREIAVPDPEDGTTLRVAAPLPPHMALVWRELGLDQAAAEAAAAALADYAQGLPGERPKR